MRKTMKYGIGLLVISVIAIVVFLYISSNDDDKNVIKTKVKYTDDYTEIIGRFTAKTSEELLKSNNDNSCYSPISLYYSLVLAAESADGQTKEEILNCLGTSDAEKIEKVRKNIDERLLDPNKDLILCNSLWIKNDYISKNTESIVATIKDKLACDIFLEETITPDMVNEWVADKTDDRIKEILSDSYPESACVMVNAMNYESKWEPIFVELSEKQDFKLENGDTVKATYIKGQEYIMEYKECEDYTMVNIPLESGEMIVIKPSKDKKVSDLLEENKINEIMALAFGNQMEKGKVSVTMPVFECDSMWDEQLKETLKELGVSKMFKGGQWAISEKLNDFDVDVFQRNTISVSKDGVKAASASAITFPLSSDDNKLMLDIVMNEPYIYVLAKNDVPLLIGTVYNPAD